MRLRFRLASLWMIALAAALLPSTGRTGPWVPAPKDYAIGIVGSLYSADDFHFGDGTRSTLSGGGLYEARAITALTELGWKKNVSFLMGVPFQSVTRRLGDGAAATTTGMGDLLLGFRYRINGGGRQVLSAELDWKAPLGYDAHFRLSQARIAQLDTTVARDLYAGDSANVVRQHAPPRLGEGQQDVQLLLLYGLSLPQWNTFAQAGAGYRYRFDAPADQVVLSTDIGYWATRRLLLSVHYAGTIVAGHGEVIPYYVLTGYVDDDNDLSTPDVPVFENRSEHDGYPDDYQEQLVGPRLTVRVDDRVDFYAGSWHTPGAENMPHKDQFYVGFTLKQTGLDRYQGFLGGTKTP